MHKIRVVAISKQTDSTRHDAHLRGERSGAKARGDCAQRPSQYHGRLSASSRVIVALRRCRRRPMNGRCSCEAGDWRSKASAGQDYERLHVQRRGRNDGQGRAQAPQNRRRRHGGRTADRTTPFGGGHLREQKSALNGRLGHDDTARRGQQNDCLDQARQKNHHTRRMHACVYTILLHKDARSAVWTT